MLKFDGLQKHRWHQKEKCPCLGVVGDFMATQTTKMLKMRKNLL
jgi:hypothetical protein